LSSPAPHRRRRCRRTDRSGTYVVVPADPPPPASAVSMAQSCRWLRLVVTQAAVGAGHWAAGRRRRALAAWTSAAGYGLVAWGLGTKRRPGPRRDRTWNRTSSGCKGRACSQAWPQGPGCRQDADTRGPPPRAPPIAVHRLFQGRGDPPVQACFHCRGDGHRRVVGRALAAAADGARDRRRSPERRDPCPLGGPGRAAAQAEDRRRVGPGRSRIGSPAAGSIG